MTFCHAKVQQALVDHFFDVFTKLENHQHSLREIWSDWLELGAILIYQSNLFMFETDLLRYGADTIMDAIAGDDAAIHDGSIWWDDYHTMLEKRYFSICEKYEMRELLIFKQLHHLTFRTISAYRFNLLGQLHFRLTNRELVSEKSSYSSQLPGLLSRLNVQTMSEIIQKHHRVFLSDPCADVGEKIFTVINHVQKLGFDARGFLVVEACTDCFDAFNILFFQLYALNIPAVVWCGDHQGDDFVDTRTTLYFIDRKHDLFHRIYDRLKELQNELEAHEQEILKSERISAEGFRVLRLLGITDPVALSCKNRLNIYAYNNIVLRDSLQSLGVDHAVRTRKGTYSVEQPFFSQLNGQIRFF